MKLPAISLHLGAHKTGSTFVQHTLLGNVNALTESGVCFIPLTKTRNTIGRAVNRQSDEFVAPARQLLAEVASRSVIQRIVLSDENLLGWPGRRPHRVGLWWPGRRPHRVGLYPRAKVHLTRLKERIGVDDEQLTIFLGVRSLDEYLPSLYCEHLLHLPFLSFGQFLNEYDLDTLSWTGLVDDIRFVFPRAEYVCWTFEAFRRAPTKIAALIAGAPERSITDCAKVSRESLSARAIEKLSSLIRGPLSAKEIRQRVEEARAAFPRSAKYPAFRPFSPVEVKCFRARYDRDVDMLRKEGVLRSG